MGMDLGELARIFGAMGASGPAQGANAGAQVITGAGTIIDQLSRGDIAGAIYSGRHVTNQAGVLQREVGKHIPEQTPPGRSEGGGEWHNPDTLQRNPAGTSGEWQNPDGGPQNTPVQERAAPKDPFPENGEIFNRQEFFDRPKFFNRQESSNRPESLNQQEMTALQAGLKLAGYESVGALDGIAGPKTNDAIEQYARDRGLQFEEGNYKAVLESLQNDQVVQMRMEHAVKQGMDADPSLSQSVQAMLKGIGHDPGVIDGQIGSRTVAAFEDYKAGMEDFGVRPVVADGCAAPSGQPYTLGNGGTISAHANDQCDRLAGDGYNFKDATGDVLRTNGTAIETPETGQPGTLEPPAVDNNQILSI